jgi:cytochrome b561
VFVDWIKWPHIPGVARNKTLEVLANNVHWITATILATAIVGHIAAFVWHKKKHNINLISRMWWNKK